MNKRLEKNFGITLIALIITIIVLLILSGVAIATLTGENGLFARAKQAKQTQTESEMKEKLNLSIQELQVEKLTEATLDDITQEWLTQKLSEYNPILKKDETTEGKKVTLQKNGIIKTYLIDIKLNITEIENENNIEFSYEIKSRNNGTRQILIKVRDSENGINKIECSNGNVIECFGIKQEKSIDYTIEVGTEYTYKVISVSGKEKKETILIEPEIIIGDAYIGTSTTETDSTESVPDNSQTRGTTLYINFTATLEKFGESVCTVKLKDGTTSDKLPYEITKNGTYTFVVTGTYNGKIVEKEIKLKVNKYQAAKNLVKYDAGDWTEDEINALKEKKLYNINIAKNASGAKGLNFTFGGFTYKKDSEGNINATYENEIGNGTVITSRNQSVEPLSKWGTPIYNGWQILEIQDSTGKIINNEIEINNKIDNLNSGEKVYITKLIHAGSPENFVYYYNTKNDAYRAEYILSGGQRQTSYNTYQARDWNMYKDKKQLNLIDEVHAMTYDEGYAITENEGRKDGLRNIKSYYWLASSYNSQYIWYVSIYGGIGNSNSSSCWGIRPVVSMKEGVYIASGDGTESNPYVLGKD